MHFCTCIVSLSGEDTQRVHRGFHAPVSWPELDVIQVIHGEGALAEVRPFVSVDQNARDERERLSRIYGREIVEGGNPQIVPVYPGRIPTMNLEAPEFTLAVGQRWINPLTGDAEIIQEDGSSLPVPKGPLVIDEFNAASPGPRGVEIVGDPRLGDPEAGTTVSRRAQYSSRKAKYDDASKDPFAA
jgi:hypothetical protein